LVEINPMNTTATCPTCHQPLPAGTAAGHCPHCLLTAAAKSLPRASAIRSFVPPPPEELNQLLEGFEVLSLLGVGGMGAVYKAIHLRLDRVVAIKLLPRELAASDPAFGERFLREARSLAKLQHPNLVVVHDFGEVDGMYFIVMEYVEGPTLRHLIQGGTLTPERSLEILPQICEGLRYAHSQGLIHRDIKPENILIGDDGRVRITDFGLARLVVSDAAAISLTGSAQALGTPHYMAPEQLQNPDAVDHRADIFALGVVFYEMLTGHLPHGRFPLPSTEAAVGPGIDEVVLRTLEPNPDKRYQQADEVERALEHSDTPPPAPAPRVAQEYRQSMSAGDSQRRSWATRAMILALAATVTAFFPWGTFRGGGFSFDSAWNLSSGTISLLFLPIPLWVFPLLTGATALALMMNLQRATALPWKVLSRGTMAAFLVAAFGLVITLVSMGGHQGSMSYKTDSPFPMSEDLAKQLMGMMPTTAATTLTPGAGVVLTTLLLLLLWFPLHRLAKHQAAGQV